MENEVVKEQKMYEINGHLYELNYTMKSVEQIEAITKESIMTTIQNPPPLQVMKALLGAALINEHGNRVSITRGMEVAEEIIKNYGLLGTFTYAIERLMEDCGFLFQNA